MDDDFGFGRGGVGKTFDEEFTVAFEGANGGAEVVRAGVGEGRELGDDLFEGTGAVGNSLFEFVGLLVQFVLSITKFTVGFFAIKRDGEILADGAEQIDLGGRNGVTRAAGKAEN